LEIKGKEKALYDKDMRPVNACGYLIDEEENIIDNEGRVRFLKDQLQAKGKLCDMYTYEGKPISIQNIIGRFSKCSQSKMIQTEPWETQGTGFKLPHAVDKDGKRVNSKGYLINEKGDIVDK